MAKRFTTQARANNKRYALKLSDGSMPTRKTLTQDTLRGKRLLNATSAFLASPAMRAVLRKALRQYKEL